MNMRLYLRFCLVSAVLVLASCASLDDIVSTPEVSLRDVRVSNLELSSQTFLLSFDVFNPNAFPLPVKTISYAVMLDGHQFASGETASSFTVPAGSDGEFSISVALNLLQTAPDLLYIVRKGARRDIP